MQHFFPVLSTAAHPYLELASVVVVCGALSALLQRYEGETSEVSRAGCQEDHCKGGEREFVFTPQSRQRGGTYIDIIRVGSHDAGSHWMMPSCEHLPDVE